MMPVPASQPELSMIMKCQQVHVQQCDPLADSPMHALDSVLACLIVLSMRAAAAAATAAMLQHADRTAELQDFVVPG